MKTSKWSKTQKLIFVANKKGRIIHGKYTFYPWKTFHGKISMGNTLLTHEKECGKM